MVILFIKLLQFIQAIKVNGWTNAHTHGQPENIMSQSAMVGGSIIIGKTPKWQKGHTQAIVFSISTLDRRSSCIY